MNKLINKLLKDNGLGGEKINEIEAKKIVLFFIRQYFDKKISISVISALADFILYENFLNKDISIQDLELSNILDVISELKYNQKSSPDDFKKSIEILRKYIENNKPIKL